MLKPDELCLSGSMNHFVISTRNEITFVLGDAGTGTAIVRHTYTPNKSNRIEVDLENIVSPLLSFELKDTSDAYRQSSVVRRFKVDIAEVGASGTFSWTFSVLRAGVDHFADSAVNFLKANFLTWQPTVKPVTYYTPEFLTYYAVVDSVVRCKAYVDANGKYDETTLTMANLSNGSVWTVPVQYAIIAGKLGKLPSYYDVWVEDASGTRLTYIQRYYASDIRSEEEQWVLFENSLGGIDTFRAYGDSENTAKHTHSVVEIENESEEYRVDTEREFKKNTGFLSRDERKWLLDFFPSLGKYLYVDAGIRRIVVTDSDVTWKAKELPSSYTFTYKYADARPYLNLSRTDMPAEVLDIKIPDVASFTVAPRLVEMDRLQLSGGALFPVQNPYSDKWNVTTAAAILEYLAREITAAYKGDGAFGHTHDNMSVLAALDRFGQYLTLDSKKVSAGYADEANDISAGSKLWDKLLRKDIPDTTRFLLTLLDGIAFKNKYGISGLGEAVLKSLKLDGAEIDEEGRGTFTGITNLGDIVTKNLTVTGMMHIFTLVIDKVKSAGGAAIFTPADGFTVDKVEPVAGGYRLYWRATDGNGLARDNMWEAGDQALCHTDNRMRAGTAHNASNKLYWCLVTKTGTGVMADISGIPTECNYIDISASDKLAGCVVNPETGDSIVMLGHRGDNKRRKSAIYISAHSSLDPTLQAPLIAQYADIDSFDISGKATSSLAFDASKGRTMLKVNGDAYIGDGNDNFIRYTPEHGLEVSAVAHFKAGTTGGENIDGISASGANLIVNSGFTGNYESIEVSESTPVSGETPVFSPALFGWSGTSIVSKDADSASGFSASLSGAISQAIPTIVPGLPYAFTAKAKGRVITVSVGGVERVFQLSGQYQTISFVAVPAVGESFSMSGDCTVCEPMLVLGRTLAAWQPGAQDNDRSMGELHALRSLTEAIQQSSTQVVGGFVLTQTIKVGNYRNKVLTEETGGMSGYRVSDNSPYIWGGGTLAQAHYTINKYAADPSYQATEEELKKMAKFVVTHGGRAILNDMILRGYVYAEGGVFKNVSSPNGNFVITETGDVKIKGEINASSGKIAGIEIHGNYLGSEIKRDANGNIIPWSGPNGRFGLYSDMISFSSPDGRQVILGTWNNFGVPLMARLSDNRPDFMPKYGIVFDIANSTFGQNYAFIGRGNGILNGVMDSYRYRRLILAEDNTVYNINDPQNGNRVFVFTDKDHTDISLPKLSAMKVFLGMSADSTEPFSIPLVIMGDLKTKGFSVFGRNDRKVRDKDGKETKPWAGDEYPLIVSYNVAEWLPTVGMAEGDVLEFMLTYDPGRDSESDRIDGKTIVYTARLIRFLQ